MTRRARLLAWAGAVTVAALGTLALDGPAPPPPGADPVYAEVKGLLREAYDVSAWSMRVPVEWAAPRLAQAGLQAWITTLPLEPEARARIEARLGSGAFVDEIVPFALFLKDLYDQPDVDDFDTVLRRRGPPAAPVPGQEHSLFRYAPPEAADAAGPGLSAAQAARLLAIYDAAWLQGPPAEGLACDGVDDARLSARAARAAPLVRALLADLAGGLDGEVADAVRGVMADPTRLDAVTLTLVEFVDAEVCKHHRAFARRVARERQLRAWLGDALADPARADGWVWLRWHASRRHAVHVVVDGLQGRLVAALADGRPGHPFLRRLVEEERLEAAARPRLPSTRPAPPMATGFLRHAAVHGAPGLLPTLAAIVRSPGFAAQGLSTTPTISVRNLPIAKTGAPVAGPGGTGIPNFHFVDRDHTVDGVRQGRPWYFYGNDALQLTPLTRAAGMTTLFERFERLVTMSCGAQYDEAAGWSLDGFVALALGEAVRDFADTRCVAELRARARNERRIAELRASLLAREPLLRAAHHPWELWDRRAQAREHEAMRAEVAELAALEPVGLPDYLLYYNPWPDHFAHGKGPFADEIIGPTGELVRLDHWLGEVAAAYADVAPRTLHGMAGDHGLTPVRWIVSPEAEVLDGLARDGVPLRVTKISSDEGEGPKLTHRLRPPSMRGWDVVVASTAGGNYMLDFFVDQGEGWARQPVLAELARLRTLGGRTVDMPAEILRRLGDSLDYLVVRETPCGPDGGTVVVMGPRDGRVATGRIERRGDRIWYGWEGADPLGLGAPSPYVEPDAATLAAVAALRDRCLAARREEPSTWCTRAEWQAATRLDPRPDAPGQLAHLYDTDRAGTVNLFPRAGVGYNTQVPGRHAGESFHEKDAFVGLWGAPVAGGAAVAENGAVPMAMYRWITGEPTPPGRDGWGYTPFPDPAFGD